MDGYRGGKVHAGAGVHLCGGGDAARQGEDGALSCQSSLLLGGAPTVAAMKGPWGCVKEVPSRERRRRQRGPCRTAADSVL
jgi:hypothetical protein